MKYVIIDIIIKENTSDGDILLVKANPVKDTMQELTDLYGTRYVHFSQTESDETETFAFPYTDENVKMFSTIAKASQNQESFWEPNDEFVDDAITDSSGEKIWVNKSFDLIPECDMDDFIPLDDFFAHIDEEYDDDDDDEEDDEEDFMYKEDLFDIDDSDSEEVEIYNSSIIDEEEPEDIFKDFYSNDAPSDYAISRKRYSEAEIKKMNVQERHEECSKCSKAKNLGGLIDFYTYFFVNGSQATNEYNVPAIAYLYGRAKDVDTLNDLLNKHSFCIWELSQDSKEVAQNLVEIGAMFPYLSGEQISYLEKLYNTPKYCEIMDDILFDKEKLPRKITGITKEELKKTNDTFSTRLLKQTYNCFILNQRAQNISDDEYTEYYVYVRRNNNIIKKEYGMVGSGECVIGGTLDMKSFIEHIEPKYGKDCADFFIDRVLQRFTWYDAETLCRTYQTWVQWDMLTDIAKDYFENDPENLDNIKLDMALLYLKRLNNSKD